MATYSSHQKRRYFAPPVTRLVWCPNAESKGIPEVVCPRNPGSVLTGNPLKLKPRKKGLSMKGSKFSDQQIASPPIMPLLSLSREPLPPGSPEPTLALVNAGCAGPRRVDSPTCGERPEDAPITELVCEGGCSNRNGPLGKWMFGIRWRSDREGPRTHATNETLNKASVYHTLNAPEHASLPI